MELIVNSHGIKYSGYPFVHTDILSSLFLGCLLLAPPCVLLSDPLVLGDECVMDFYRLR